MAIHAITVVSTTTCEYRFVQHDWVTELDVVDTESRSVLDQHPSVALPGAVATGRGFTIDVLGIDNPRPLVVLEPVTSVAVVRVDPTKELAPSVRALLGYC